MPRRSKAAAREPEPSDTRAAHPLAGIIVAIFFAALRVGSTTMQTATGVPTSVSDIIQALVIVFTVAGMAMVKLPEFKNWFARRARKEV